ncbi:MAG TPA: contractile injection system protein, VgrG/Pvc8 family [Candidatus Dormibacteraeota bacterium]|nr:contractile injection system protein, VgrG/Pvc8 family [Candidatus Dormibacteraeota bacterium]
MSEISYSLKIGGSPAPADVIASVKEVEVESTVDAASILRLRLAIAQTEQDDWTLLKDDLFKPLTPLSISVSIGTQNRTLLNAYVATTDVSYSATPGESTCEVIALDATMLMNLEEKVTAWANQSDSDIANAVLQKYNLGADVHSVPGSLKDPEGTPMQRGTDSRFLRRLAQRNGFEFYIQPTPSGTDQAYFGPPKLSDPFQAVISLNVGLGTNVTEFKVSYHMLRPTTVVAATLDVPSKSPQPVSVSTASTNQLGNQSVLSRVSTTPVLRPAQTGLMHSADLNAMAQGVVDRSSWALEAEGTIGPDVGVLRPGLNLNVRGAGAAYSGTYYVVSVTHRITLDGYLQRFRAWRNAVSMSGSEGYKDTDTDA